MLKKFTQKMVSFLMIFMLMFNLFSPTITFAEGEDEKTVEERRNYEIKKEEEWDISENGDGSVIAEWTLEDRTLRISGEGKMKEYAPGNEKYEKYENLVKEIIIEDGVTNIGSYAFSDFINLESVTIPKSVTIIGWGAFDQCGNLKNVTIANGVTIINSCAFRRCTSLKNITIPNSVTKIAIGAFDSCTSLESIKIPNSVIDIVYNIFKGCSSLESIEVEKNNPNYMSEEGILYTKDKTKIIAYPAGKKETICEISDNVTSIGENAFYECNNLESIVIPNSVTHMDNYSFYQCNNLVNITMPEDIEMEEKSFYGIPGILYKTDNGRKEWDISKDEDGSVKAILTVSDKTLTITGTGETKTLNGSNEAVYNEYCSCVEKIVIGDEVKVIKKYLLCHFDNLKSVIMSENIKSIGYYSFYDCKSLEIIEIPASVTFIGDGTFSNCENLKNIKVAKNNQSYTDIDGVLYTKDETEIIKYPGGKNDTSYIIKDSVTSIRDYAFDECSNLESIIVPNSVEDIRFMSFSGVPYIICNINSYAHSYAESERVLYYLNLKSDVYTVVDSMIKHIKPNTNVENALKNIITVTTNRKVVNTKGQTLRDTEIIGTGMKLVLDDEKEYELSIIGDVDGDGIIGLKDLIKINRQRLGKNVLTGIYLESGDVNNDGEITLKDLVQINRARLGK